jgi:hypothetical protein
MKLNPYILGGAAVLGYFLLKPKNKNTSFPAMTVPATKGINGYVENLHLISVKYLGTTNTRGTKLKIESKRFGQSVTLSYDYKIGNIRDQAVQYLQSRGFSILGSGEFGGIDIIVSNTFNPLK